MSGRLSPLSYRPHRLPSAYLRQMTCASPDTGLSADQAANVVLAGIQPEMLPDAISIALGKRSASLGLQGAGELPDHAILDVEPIELLFGRRI